MNIIIPGLHNSNEDHWQSHFEKSDPSNFRRIHQENWDEPDCLTWTAKLERDLKGSNYSDLVLIGHSIGCITIAMWFEKYRHKIKGALLVAPTDAEKDNFPSYISGFTPIPDSKLPFPSIVVASTNDHVTSIERARLFATNWGSELHIIEKAGHIEPKSGFGKWDLGLKLIESLQ